MQETIKYSDKPKANKESAKGELEAEDMISAMTLTNGHHEQVNGRSALFYDILLNPRFQPQNLYRRFASVMQGTMLLDEETGEMINLNIKSVRAGDAG